MCYAFFNFTSVEFLNDDYDDYDIWLVETVRMRIYLSNEIMKIKKFDVVLRSCNKQ